jgi:hypothetical protein
LLSLLLVVVAAVCGRCLCFFVDIVCCLCPLSLLLCYCDCRYCIYCRSCCWVKQYLPP